MVFGMRSIWFVPQKKRVQDTGENICPQIAAVHNINRIIMFTGDSYNDKQKIDNGTPVI